MLMETFTSHHRITLSLPLGMENIIMVPHHKTCVNAFNPSDECEFEWNWLMYELKEILSLFAVETEFFLVRFA